MVVHGSTTLLKEGFGAYGSRATVMGGCAVIDAANNLLEAFRGAAAKRLGVEAASLTIANGEARAADGRVVKLAECAADKLAVDGVFHNNKPTFTYGTAVAEVYQNLLGILQYRVVAPAADVDDRADATTILLVAGIVQTLVLWLHNHPTSNMPRSAAPIRHRP